MPFFQKGPRIYRQGLWPGRRWTGKEGTSAGLRALEAVQMDPLNIVARSHDIVLWDRVLDYRPEMLNSWLYEERQFFDYGGWLAGYPMSELPFWHLPMRRRESDRHWSAFAATHPNLLNEIRTAVRKRDPLGNRDFTGRTRVRSYRGTKDTALALFYLWLTGELMTHHRNGFERVYDLRQRVALAAYDYAAPDDEAEARAWLDRLVQSQKLVPVSVVGSAERWFILADDVTDLQAIETGVVPASWQLCHTTKEDEVVFLSPFEIVSARERSTWLFDFESPIELYVPADKHC